MGRADAFAMSNAPKESILDGLGNGIGYGSILIIVSMVREIFGTGQIYGYQIIPLSMYVENGGWGSTWAAPIASLMIEKYLKKTITNK